MKEEVSPLSNPVFRKISRIVDDMGVEAYVVGGYVRDYYLREQWAKDGKGKTNG